jgi:hypothetical protein
MRPVGRHQQHALIVLPAEAAEDERLGPLEGGGRVELALPVLEELESDPS